ncbi:MAG: type I restriction enzyme HsdR N-terminal domain-containing protein [Bacteroides sp.]|nr:type I restriction enzyme HsdR N-terminal domain-containing protein [Bacteroides sp.]
MTPEEFAAKYPRLNLPAITLRIQEDQGRLKVFDPLRKKYVVLTPEEHVRQHFTGWMRQDLHYPASIMANEIGIEVNGTRKRCDTVVFGPDGRPLMIVEFKAPEVTVTQDTFDQIVRYNMTLRARYLVVSNGMRHYCCVIDYKSNSYQFIPELPDYDAIRRAYSEN